ncbi:MAG: PhzF family phenazine biosynthesis protein [Rhodobacter sp.]|jgi:trans-2,3-dihydro-3-hydroxyanthranilate isomerase|nr:PhzF family phenazine biosynthesis protein [Rhodobacter sp.]
MPFEYDWVDAFTAHPFGGNGCAVIYGADALDDDTCMAIVRETGLVECTFLGRSITADVKVRYFMADREIPFAGHPTVATVASMVDRGIVGEGQLRLETGAGMIPVDIELGADGVPMVTMTQVRPQFGAEVPAELVAAVGGLQADDILGTPRVVSTGLPFCITLVKDRETLRRLRLDIGALKKLRARSGDALAEVMEPFWVALEGESTMGHTFSRLLLAPPLPAEDPFTGSATGAMAAYVWAEGYLTAPDFTAEQGHWLGRPGRAEVEVLGPRDDITGVRVGGQGYVLMRGFLNI